jgi:hypothetical protein
MIYFIEAVGGDRVKIGFTVHNSVQQRIRTLQTGSSHPLRLIHSVNGGRREEKFLHRKYKSHRVVGEWFHLSPIRDEISSIDRVMPVPAPPKKRVYRNYALADSDLRAWFFHVTDGAWGKPPFTV